MLVDWKRKGSEGNGCSSHNPSLCPVSLEGHFQYGPEGFDLFGHLFEAGERCRRLP